ncbi:TRAP transporter permease [Desulfovibrio sp.]|uniref:TRAP transporter permease n=1 Tax=Desulfovibrio sp. TaxID=885 RepID=UPI0023C52A69|nr:TRAP transporter permease [Desulfovibrio sp.]MDE7241352.1 TRAP transporter permease [Desulfovibrio sp.]
MSHKERMQVIGQEGSGGFALEEGSRLDSDAAEKIQDTLDVSEIVAKYDKEATFRTFRGWLKIFISCVCIVFSGFQLFTAATGLYPPQIQRSIHLGFVLVLIYLLYPARADGNKHRLNWYDVLLAAAGAAVCGYIIWNYDTIVLDAGPPTEMDFIFGCASILLVLEATRRIVGLPITLVAIVFLLYAKFGNLLPGMMGHPGFSLKRIVGHMYLTTEGLFGMPLGVAASFVFLFILFGAFLHSTGLGKFFIDLALGAAGRFVGGPAKVAVLASGFFGTISGSSVANTVSTGTFTIPLMKSVGYRGAFAGAVEAASSTGGQIMPPIMGAAAFIMAQFLGVGYVEIAKAALIPALLYYLAVGFMVHMEAKRLGLKGIPKDRLPKPWHVLRHGGYLLIPIIVLVYLLMQGYTPLKSAYYCIVTTVVISLVANNWKAWAGAGPSGMTVRSSLAQCNRMALKDVLMAMENGGRLALGVSAACACTGFVIGVVTLTGVGLKLANAILALSAGSFALTLVLTMFSSIILGMGLPTTAKYIVLATIAAPAIQSFGVPQLAAHLFIMYFGILADLTPPVALAAYAAAGIARAEPNATGFMAVKLAFAGFLIPYIFCYNPALLMIGADTWEIVFIVCTAAVGIAALSFASVGYWLRNLFFWERLILVGAAITLITPGLKTDIIGLGLMAGVYVLQRVFKAGPGQPLAQGGKGGAASDAA